MSTTLKDIAKESGLSICCVSQVLNHKPSAQKYSEAKKNKIFETAARLGYCRNELAHSMANKHSNIISVVYSRAPILSPLLSGIVEEAGKQNLSIKLQKAALSDNNLTKILEVAESYKVAGIIGFALTPEQEESLYRHLQKYDCALAISKASNEATPYSTVSTDQAQAAALAIRHLYELGHRKIACLFRQEDIKSIRIQTYLNLLNELNCESKSFHHNVPLANIINWKPDAVVCENDIIAMELLVKCYEKKIFIPEQFSVTGFGGVFGSEYTPPPLTTIAEPFFEIGANLVSLVVKQMQGCNTIHNIKLTAKLLQRKSTAKIKKQ